MTTRWTLSLRDWRSHAVDELADHPDGPAAVCGHLLVAGAALHDEPFGTPCGLCVALRLASLHATHLAGAFGQLEPLRRLAGDLRGLVDEAPGLPAAALRGRLGKLADLVDGATGALDRELTHLTDTTMARHDQLTADWPTRGGRPDGRQLSG